MSAEDIREAVAARLADWAGLSNLTGERVYWGQLPQSPTLPALVTEIVSVTRMRSHDGSSGLPTARIQVTAVGVGEGVVGAAKDLRRTADQVRLALDGWIGIEGGVRVTSSRLDEEQDLTDTETRTRQIVLDFMVTYCEET